MTTQSKGTLKNDEEQPRSAGIENQERGGGHQQPGAMEATQPNHFYPIQIHAGQKEKPKNRGRLWSSKDKQMGKTTQKGTVFPDPMARTNPPRQRN